ncbi:hypothetical protein Fmac_001299 [Flemingia macrophylla]|uniref:Uncharacterized protein n=1 Tax=Flemingia macrophylla TaxID=520843 RepID=A0ABD1NGQ6_9FABA
MQRAKRYHTPDLESPVTRHSSEGRLVDCLVGTTPLLSQIKCGDDAANELVFIEPLQTQS